MFIYFGEREAEERVQARKGQSKRDTESEAGYRLQPVSTEPESGLPLDVRCPRDLSHPGAPRSVLSKQ